MAGERKEGVKFSKKGSSPGSVRVKVAEQIRQRDGDEVNREESQSGRRWVSVSL